MQTQTLVNASADVVTITHLKSGDVYKRLDKEYNGYKIYFGIVTSVLHNGADAAITSIEFDPNYSTITATRKVFGTDADLKIFAATPEEVEVHLQELKDAAGRAIKEAEKNLAKSRESLTLAEQAFATAKSSGLTTAAVQHAEAREVSA